MKIDTYELCKDSPGQHALSCCSVFLFTLRMIQENFEQVVNKLQTNCNMFMNIRQSLPVTICHADDPGF